MDPNGKKVKIDQVYLKEKTFSAQFEEIGFCIYFLNLITSTVLRVTVFFSQFSNPFLLGPPSYFILSFPLHLCPPHVAQVVGLDPCHINIFMKSLGSSCKAENYCSSITSSLMRPESQLQSIQCDDSSFPQIFHSSHLSCTFMMHILIIRIP